MLTLDLGPDLKLPALEAQTQTYIVYGGKGMGKTNSIAVFAEELDRHKLKFSLLDPVGVSWGLKHSANGKGPGIDVLILGGIHADLPIEPTAGAVVADFVVDEDVSVIIDISRKPDGRMWSHNEQIKFVRDYCTQLFARNGERRRPLMQLIDECGRFAPEMTPAGALDLQLCKSSIEQLVEWGRNVGIGVYLSTQRSARMAKSISELADVMIAFRTIGPRSINSIVDWFGEHIDKVLEKDYIKQIRELGRGIAMVVSPGWLHLEGAFSLRARRTFDSSATPVAGQERKPSGKGTRLPDLTKYRALMAETIERAEQSDPRALNRRIGELEKLLAKAEQRQAVPAPAPAPVPAEPEIITVVPDEVWAIHAVLRDLSKLLGSIESDSHSGLGSISQALDALEHAKKVMDDERKQRKSRKVQPARTPQDVRSAKPVQAQPSAAPKRMAAPPPVDGNVTLPKAERSYLTVLARFPEGCNRKKLVLLAGYPWNGNTRNVFARLRSSGFIVGGNSEQMRITEAGMAAVGTVDEIPTGDDFQAYWYNELPKAERTFLQHLVKIYPEKLVGPELAEATGYPWNGNTRNVLSRLRTLELIEGANMSGMSAAPDFMGDEAVAS